MNARNQLAILIDRNDKIVGYKEKIEAHRWPTPLHRAVSVVVCDGEKVLLQKRSTVKPVWPLYWCNTCCANVLKGETYAQCAKRRLKEEMGIDTSLKEVFKFKYRARYDKHYGEHEIDHVFVGEYSGEVVVDPNEAADYKWIRKGQLLIDLKNHPEKYSPWFKIISKRLFTK